MVIMYGMQPVSSLHYPSCRYVAPTLRFVGNISLLHLPPMITVKDLSKSYSSLVALDDVSFEIAQGEIVGLLGPNGAGKTTLIKIMTGYLHPDAGAVTIHGFDVMDDTLEVQKQIGYLPENAPLYPELTVQAYLSLMADLHHMDPDERVPQILEAVDATGLRDRLSQRIGTLSKGYRQRVGIAQAIMHKPALLIFDEPTVGLDPTQILEIRSLIRTLSEHSTVLFSTHILAEVEALCDRVLILLNGSLRADDVLSRLRGTADVILVLQKDVAQLRSTLAQLPAVVKVTREPGANGSVHYRIQGHDTRNLSSLVFMAAKEHGWPVQQLYNEVATLESTFNSLALAG